jgi:pimeloyl-ACP methyl ester carboxylesterase
MGKAKKQLTNERRARRLGTGEGIAAKPSKGGGGGIPGWAWLVAASVIVAAAIIGVALVARGGSSSSGATLLPCRKRTSLGQSIIFLNAPMGVLPLSRLMETPHSIYTDGIPFTPEVIQAAVQQNWKGLPTIAELAADHTALIRSAGLAESCILAGYSSGGVLAFEVAHQLQRDGIPVSAVLLFDADLHAAGWKRLRRWPGCCPRSPICGPCTAPGWRCSPTSCD